MAIGPGTHHKGPLLGDRGIFNGVALGVVDNLRSPYKTYLETFDTPLKDGDLEISGSIVTAINSPGTATEVVNIDKAAPYLLINPGTSVDSGSEVQFNRVNTGSDAVDIRPLRTLGPITSTSTLMDGRELFFQTRVGIQTDATVGAGMDGHIVVGWIVSDTTLMSNTTGVLSLSDGGGFGFHINGDPGGAAAGATAFITPFASEAAITTDPTVNTGVVVPDVIADLTTRGVASQFYWYTLGAKMRVVDADNATGVVDFYINGRLVDSIVDSTCMDTTRTFSMTYGVHNGPVDKIDVAVDYMLTGITRHGLTYPYDTAADVASF